MAGTDKNEVRCHLDGPGSSSITIVKSKPWHGDMLMTVPP